MLFPDVDFSKVSMDEIRETAKQSDKSADLFDLKLNLTVMEHPVQCRVNLYVSKNDYDDGFDGHWIVNSPDGEKLNARRLYH